MVKKFIEKSIQDLESGDKKAIIKVGAAAIILPGGIAIFAGLVGYMAYKWIKKLGLKNKDIHKLLKNANKEISKSKTISEKEKLKHKIESSNIAANQKNIKKITLKK